MRTVTPVEGVRKVSPVDANRSCCILIHNFLELSKIWISKVHRKIRILVNHLRIHPLFHRVIKYTVMFIIFVKFLKTVQGTVKKTVLFQKRAHVDIFFHPINMLIGSI